MKMKGNFKLKWLKIESAMEGSLWMGMPYEMVNKAVDVDQNVPIYQPSNFQVSFCASPF